MYISASYLLASVAEVDRVDGSPGFPPADQVLGGGSLPRVEALAGRGLAALGRGGSGCGDRLVLRRHGARRLAGIDRAGERERFIFDFFFFKTKKRIQGKESNKLSQ